MSKQLDYSFAPHRNGHIRLEQVYMENDSRFYTRIHVTLLSDRDLSVVDMTKLSQYILSHIGVEIK